MSARPDAGPTPSATAPPGPGDGDLARLAAEVRARDADLVTQIEARTRAEAELAAIRASTSWRITAPLRAVIRRLRGDRSG